MKSFCTFLAATVILMTACSDYEDPGPVQKAEKSYALIDFDRLEMGSAFHIEVTQGNNFGIDVRGDRRNISDLVVYKRGSTLIIEYDENESRKHDTYINITMPALKSIHFSGASESKVSGFESEGDLDLYLSGASVSQLDAGYGRVNAVVSGASNLRMSGLGDELDVELSGASILSAFDYPVREAILNVSGASNGKLTVSDDLDVVASGASAVLYRGNPTVTSETSGSSTVSRD
ncbi:head GIN domain-containing protein [Pseudochryseolinea flava]|uniref:DUF2807 domain-containing protein n=1 Tax=Pseudochryseolinea flava TaxID=2059302 RepID=A0A364XUV0_9BACT|nr:head GIN domain-containing protein [Pseudochryseolinea flava]RAV97903.1 DUF2807 domain-containing protein [Pseudochryseolinea flava]